MELNKETKEYLDRMCKKISNEAKSVFSKFVEVAKETTKNNAGKKIYEYDITDTYHCKIPVLATSLLDADLIFNEWISSLNGMTELDDILENGYMGRKIESGKIIDAANYPADDIFLPKERNRPYIEKPSYTLYIRLNDAENDPIFLSDLSFESVISKLDEYRKDYTLVPDPKHNPYIQVLGEGLDTYMYFYGIRKE